MKNLVFTSMRYMVIIFLLFLVTSCDQRSKISAAKPYQNRISPFKLIVIDFYYAMAYGVKYEVTKDSLKVIFRSELEGEGDSIIYAKALQPSQAVAALAELEVDSLKDYYINECVQDGKQLLLLYSRGEKLKRLQLSNYYHPVAGMAVELINSLVPVKYHIRYNMAALLKEQEKCKIDSGMWPIIER